MKKRGRLLQALGSCFWCGPTPAEVISSLSSPSRPTSPKASHHVVLQEMCESAGTQLAAAECLTQTSLFLRESSPPLPAAERSSLCDVSVDTTELEREEAIVPTTSNQAAGLSIYPFARADTRLRVDKTQFPNQFEIVAKINSFVGGNWLEWLETGSDDVKLMSHAAKLLMLTIKDLYDARFAALLADMHAVFLFDPSSSSRQLLTLCEHTANEMIRPAWTELFWLSEDRLGVFQTCVLTPLRTRFKENGLSSFNVDDHLLELVSLDVWWIIAACALSGPPYELHTQLNEVGKKVLYQKAHHRLVDGQEGAAVGSVRVLFPWVPELLSHSICLPDNDENDITSHENETEKESRVALQ